MAQQLEAGPTPGSCEAPNLPRRPSSQATSHFRPFPQARRRRLSSRTFRLLGPGMQTWLCTAEQMAQQVVVVVAAVLHYEEEQVELFAA